MYLYGIMICNKTRSFITPLMFHFCRFIHEVKVTGMQRYKLDVQSSSSTSPNTDNFHLIVVSLIKLEKKTLMGLERFFSSENVILLGRFSLRANFHCERCIARRLQVRHYELQRLQKRISVSGDV